MSTEQLSETVTIHLGDCLGILPTIGPVGVVLTDPPYGQSYTSGYATPDLWVDGPAIANDHSPAARDAALAALAGTPAIVFGNRKIPVPVETRMILTWDKGPALGMGAIDLPWKPSSEEIYIIGRGFVGARDESNVLYHPPVQSMAKNGRVHPNEKPVGLLARLLKKCPPGPVLDPFMGSGSTGVACIQMGRPFIGIEIRPKYFEIARRRLLDQINRPRLDFGEVTKPTQESLI